MPEDEIEQLFDKGRTLMAGEDYASAIAVFESFIPKTNSVFDKASAFMNCGICYSELGNFDDARLYFNNALKLKPDFSIALLNRGLMYHRSGNLESAIDDYNSAIKLQPAFAEAHNEKGFCLVQSGSLDDAFDCFKAAVSIVPDNSKYLGNAGKICLMLEHPDDALKYFLKQAKADTKSAEAHVNIAKCYRVMDNFIEAINSVQTALVIDKNYADAYEERGISMCAINQFSHAVLDFYKALKISRNPEIIDKLYFAVSESAFFNLSKSLKEYCVLAKAEKITVDELIKRFGEVIDISKNTGD